MEREREREKEGKLLFIECVIHTRDYSRCFSHISLNLHNPKRRDPITPFLRSS